MSGIKKIYAVVLDIAAYTVIIKGLICVQELLHIA